MAYSELAISNIAWPSNELPAGLKLAGRLGLQGVEIAPYNVFGRWDIADDDIRTLRSHIEDAGLVCPALQGILFNVAGAALFGGPESRTVLAEQLARVARMAGLLGASACVFGAPKQRDPGELPMNQARDTAADFLRRLGPVFAENGTTLAFEANARAYSCRFITTTAEAIDFVSYVDAEGIALQIDIGTVFLEGEAPEVLAAAAPLAVHAHISEPGLQPIGTGGVDHSRVARTLKGSAYRGFLSIEMKAVENWQEAVEKAVRLTREEYL